MSDIRIGPRASRRATASRLALFLGSAGAVVAVCALAVGASPARAATDVATSTLADLTIADAPALGLTAFHGRFGTAASAADAGLDESDLADPDGVRAHLTVEGALVSRTDAEPARNYATAQAAGFTLALTRPDFLSLGSLDTYAECVPPPVGPLALAYAHTDSDVIDVLGHDVPVGTSQFDVTGAELGLDSISSATLTVTYDRFEDPSGGGFQPVSSARAGVDITVTGTFTGTDGQEVYAGPVTRLELGHVAVTCEGTTPTESPTVTPTETPTETPTVTPTETPTETPTVTPTETPTVTPTVTPTETPTPTPTPTVTPTPTPTVNPTGTPTVTPTPVPTTTPTVAPTITPTPTPTVTPTVSPTHSCPPTPAPTVPVGEYGRAGRHI